MRADSSRFALALTAMPRLLILCEFPTLLGGERSMLATIPSIRAAGFDVHIAAPPVGPLADALRATGVVHHPWPTHDEHRQRLPLDELRATLAALVARLRPNLVHANSLSTSRIAGPVAAEAAICSVGHLRDIVRLSRQAIDDVNRHRRLVAVSRATRDFHVAQGIDAARCVTVYNGVDLDTFRPRPATGYLHGELELPPRSRLLAVIGQLGLRKGTEVALAAALQLADKLPDDHWLIVGERTSNKDESHEFEALLRSMAEEPPLRGRVHFLGSRPDVPQLMNECQLLVHAARQEPLGRVLLEAAASGLAVVATDVGGTREIFPTPADGAILVPPDNFSALANAIFPLFADEPCSGATPAASAPPSPREALSRAARRRAETAFDIHHAAHQVLNLYQQLLK